MDGLIVVLLILGLVARISKKKKNSGNARRGGAARGVAEKITDALEMAGKEAAKQAKIPYTKEEWSQYLRQSAAEEDARAPIAPMQAAEPAARIAPPPPAPGAKPVSRPLKPKPVQREARSEAEAPREGESRREHAAHLARIAREEEKIARRQEEIKRLRDVNLEKLRSAVVMSEVLGKPLALRGNNRMELQRRMRG